MSFAARRNCSQRRGCRTVIAVRIRNQRHGTRLARQFPVNPHISAAGVVAALMLSEAGSLAAQSTAGPLPRVSANDLLAGRPVATTFEALRPMLDGRREVIVTDKRRRQRRGRVVSLAADRIVLADPFSSCMWEGMLPRYWLADVAVILKRGLLPSGSRAFDKASHSAGGGPSADDARSLVPSRPRGSTRRGALVSGLPQGCRRRSTI